MEAKAQIEANVVELADEEESVDACVEQEDFVEDGKMGRPGMLEPAEIDGEPKVGEEQKIAPVAVLGGIDAAGLLHEDGDGDGQERVEGEPAPGEYSAGVRNEYVRDTEDGWSEEA